MKTHSLENIEEKASGNFIVEESVHGKLISKLDMIKFAKLVVSLINPDTIKKIVNIVLNLVFNEQNVKFVRL